MATKRLDLNECKKLNLKVCTLHKHTKVELSMSAQVNASTNLAEEKIFLVFFSAKIKTIKLQSKCNYNFLAKIELDMSICNI